MDIYGRTILFSMNNRLKGLKAIFGSVDIFSFLFASAAVLFAVILLVYKLSYYRRKRYLTVEKDRKSAVWKLTGRLDKNPAVHKILYSLAVKISMFNKYSHEKNMEYATVACIIIVVFTAASIAVFMPSVSTVWYITASYIIMAVTFAVMAFLVFSLLAKQRFTNKMPNTYKLLNSRYIITGNILKAINISMDDFDRAVRKEMLKIYDVLKKNNMDEINNTFKMIEDTYRNEYLTLLLNLIRQAHYKGGSGAIKRQFEETTEEILLDIENQRDLSLTSRTYIFIALFLPFGVRWLERFNFNALGDSSVEFYSSPLGTELKIVFYFLFLVYLGVLLFMERIS